jgi:O-acetyl-ADP-ribose deacetylase (regulator of RNase III)
MERQVLRHVAVGQCAVEVVQGDLTREKVDAMVNAANSQLLHGGGLAGAIVRRGGETIQRESDEIAPVEVGGAAVTGAGELPARWVIHAVGPRWGEGDEEPKLRSAIRASLERAVELEVRSIAVPAVSTGIFGYPQDRGTRVIVDEVMSWLRGRDDAGLENVRLVAMGSDTAAAFARALDEIA